VTLTGDSIEYELLTEAARKTTVPGMVCEVGTRLGAGIQAIIDGISGPRPILSIDPYGDVAYHHSDAHPKLYGHGYDQAMLVQALATIPAACHAKGHLWLPFIMEDSEFFRRFADGVPLYAGVKHVANDYAFVHLDGPHTTEKVGEETEFFLNRVPLGGVIAYDNWYYFNAEGIGEMLTMAGFELEVKGEEKMIWRRWR
jgi:hypothetical protein